jgi:DNA-binding YbaB/EbfC family protein
MFGDMMGKLQEMKSKTDEVKKRLDTISVNADAENGLVKVVCTANRKITSITIADELMSDGDKEQIEDLTILAVNRALDKAEKVAETEMAGVARGIMPGM